MPGHRLSELIRYLGLPHASWALGKPWASLAAGGVLCALCPVPRALHPVPRCRVHAHRHLVAACCMMVALMAGEGQTEASGTVRRGRFP